jgi:UDP-N-acetyl-D-mannosaminuronic acid dehydrogenase
VSARIQTVCVVGLGYIGLPTAAVMAHCGLQVVGLDINPTVVRTINSGHVHIVEPDLEDSVRAAVRSGRLRATSEPCPADAFLIAVPTPFTGNDHRPDISYVESAACSIAGVLKPGNLIILESTSPVGTTEHITALLTQQRTDLTFPDRPETKANIQVVYCPERVLPGRILTELVTNDRLIGGMSPYCAKKACDLYRHFVQGELLLTNARTAEMAKLAENAFRDVNIAFANELSILCDRLQVDVWELIRLANRHPRVKILQPGPGVGGHCVAVDPWFLVDAAPECARLIRTAREVNDAKPDYIIARVLEKLEHIPNPVIACLGLAFKADVDDLRESPAVHIVERLAARSRAPILVAEPFIRALPPSLNGASGLHNIHLVSADQAVAQANVVVLLVSHRAFAGIDRAQLHGKTVIDTRGVWQ